MSKSRSIHFFATKHDIESVLMAIESKLQLQYVRTALANSPSMFAVQSYKLIPDLGVAVRGDQVHEASYIVLNADEQVTIREVPQRRGGVMYAIDQQANPTSIAFRPGGVYQHSAVIAGQAGTCTDDPTSHELANLFAREIRRQFKRIKSFFVGPEAERLLDAGYRLTIGVTTSREIDLVKD
jgi:ribosomal protein S4